MSEKTSVLFVRRVLLFPFVYLHLTWVPPPLYSRCCPRPAPWRPSSHHRKTWPSDRPFQKTSYGRRIQELYTRKDTKGETLQLDVIKVLEKLLKSVRPVWSSVMRPKGKDLFVMRQPSNRVEVKYWEHVFARGPISSGSWSSFCLLALTVKNTWKYIKGTVTLIIVHPSMQIWTCSHV